MNLPGLLCAGMLVERHLGLPLMLAAYLTNCAVSAGVQTFYHRQIGYKRVASRGRMTK